MKIELTVPGKPQQWARARRNKAGASYTPDHVVAQMDKLVLEWKRAGELRFPDQTPLSLHAAFLYERPKNHYRTGKFSALLKDGYEFVEPIGIPDTDNLLKLIGDSLKGLAFDDDSRFTVMCGMKAYLPRGTYGRTIVVMQPNTFQWRRLILGAVDFDLQEGQA